MTIVELESRIAALAPEPRAAAERIFAVSTTTGTLVAPDQMRPWIEKQFGSVEAVTSQRIVRVTDRVTLEGALFNDLRAKRPMSVPEKSGAEVAETIRSTENDPFCSVATGTPADDFGRISGALGVTASNVAKYDGYHGVLVFNAHDPLAPMDAAAIADHLSTARRWAEAAVERDPAAPYYFLMWNCLWRAGGSIVHGHMQMTTTRGMHYPKVERLRRAALAYAAEHRRDYFDDLWLVHDALGLGVTVDGARVFATLTPVKERELVVLGAPGRSGWSRTISRCTAHRSLRTAPTGGAFRPLRGWSTAAIRATGRAISGRWSSTPRASSRRIRSWSPGRYSRLSPAERTLLSY